MSDDSEKEYTDYFLTGQSIYVDNHHYVLGKNLFQVDSTAVRRVDYGCLQKLAKRFMSTDMILP